MALFDSQYSLDQAYNNPVVQQPLASPTPLSPFNSGGDPSFGKTLMGQSALDDSYLKYRQQQEFPEQQLGQYQSSIMDRANMTNSDPGLGKTLGGLSSLMGPQPLAGMQGRPPSPLNYEEQVAAQQQKRLDGDMGRYVGIGEGDGPFGANTEIFNPSINTSAGPMLPEPDFRDDFALRADTAYREDLPDRVSINQPHWYEDGFLSGDGRGFPQPTMPDYSQPYPYDPPLRPPTMPTPPPMPTPTPMPGPPMPTPTPMPGDVGYVPYGSRNNQLVPPGYEKPSFVQGLAGGGPVGNLSFVELLKQIMEN